MLSHANAWHRETASRLLYERQDKSVVPLLDKQALTAPSAIFRMHSLYALDGLKALRAETVLGALKDSDANVREHALKLSERFSNDENVRRAVAVLVNDPELRIRYQFAFCAGEFPNTWKLPFLAQLLKRDGANPWIRLAVLSSLNDGAPDVLAKLQTDTEFHLQPHASSIVNDLIVLIARKNDTAEIARLLTLGERDAVSPEVRRGVILSILRGNPACLTNIRASAAAMRMLEEHFLTARNTLADASVEGSKRIEAIQALQLSDAAPDLQRLFAELDCARSADVQSAALAALQNRSDAPIAQVLLERWPRYTPAIRREAEEMLFNRPESIRATVAAVEQQKLSAKEFGISRWQTLTQSRDARTAKAAKKILNSFAIGTRQEVFPRYKTSLQTAGDAERGRALFRKECSICHRLEEQGVEIGPNLATIQNRGAKAILLNILDPNREVNPQFINYAVLLRDGRSVSGMIREESATSITLMRAENKPETLLRSDLETIQSTGLSLMPEGIEQRIDPAAMADLLAYLLQVK